MMSRTRGAIATLHPAAPHETTVTPGPVGYVLAFIGCVVLAYITIFFNAALVYAANERMNGGDPTIGSALRGLLLLVATGSTVLAVLGVALFVIWVILVSVVSAALSAIYQTALYHYATTGSSPAAFTTVDLGHAFEPKR